MRRVTLTEAEKEDIRNFNRLKAQALRDAETRTITHAIRLHLSLYFPQIMELAQELWFDNPDSE